MARDMPLGGRGPDQLVADMGQRLVELRRVHQDLENELELYLASPGLDHRSDRQVLHDVLRKLQTAPRPETWRSRT